MANLWKQYAWAFHLGGLIFLAGMAWAGAQAQSSRIDKLETQYRDVPSSLSRIEQKVDDLRTWMEHDKGR